MWIVGSARFAHGLLIAAALMAGCRPDPEPAAAESHLVVADVILSVSNLSRQDMGIYLLVSQVEHPLGVVRARSSRSFSLPGGLGDGRDNVRFVARERRTAGGIQSALFDLGHGQQVVWEFDQKGTGVVTTK